ncbi:MAG TPA: hypothetical protein VEA80_04440 [Vitreimonas sp.]|uniref:hypothetical protein n=1 Tax=Vitreimonas sp. TaxID=3069702 RepID=UPI002D3DADA0|nr:hypothetical protein [Vitreimonas sp.]HYD86701.1 hypothetical protein [Vitreimonas sp.]
MAHETILPLQRVEPPARPPRANFLRSERLVFLVGAAGLGGLIGFVMAVAMGRQDMWSQLLAGAPVLALALLLACATFVEAQRRAAYGCSVMAAAHGMSLIAWPLFIPLPAAFWVAPALALGSVALLASCWNGSSSVIYRAGAQASLVAALAAYQGVLIVLG